MGEEFSSSRSGGKSVSIADLIVPGGCAGVEGAAEKAGLDITVPFGPGRTDASQDQTAGQYKHGVFTERPETLTNDFFANLLDMGTQWSAASEDDGVFEGRDRATGELKWTGSRVDLILGSHSQLRAIAEVYAQDHAQEKFLSDFVAAWVKVMDADRFDRT